MGLSKTKRICKQCRKAFYVRKITVKFSAAKYCSRKCYDQARTIPLKIRFDLRVGATTKRGCILWKGITNADGYGLIGSGTRKGRNILAHRLSYEFKFGSIPKGMMILHKCDNPPCINPDHLFIGTAADNIHDMVAKGRARKRVPGSRRYLEDVRKGLIKPVK